MDWTRENGKALRNALTSGFRSTLSMKRFVSDDLGLELNTFSNCQATEEAADKLIEYFKERGEVFDLVVAICKARPNNPEVSLLAEQCKCDPLLYSMLPISTEKTIKEGVRSNNEVIRQASESIPPIENSGTGYLVIAVFWQERTLQKFRVQPKLCHQDPQTQEIVQEPLTQEDVSVDLKSFPDFVERIISLTSKKLTKYFPDPITPWKLVISLFVPVDLLSFPLSNWCGKNNDMSLEYPLEYPIVLGCSDRFDPDRSQDAIMLHNHLKEGWQRLQRDIQNDQCKLHNITWLNSDQASSNSLKKYSGFQCYGNWLRSGKEYLTNWQELIKSGIPLALWMEKGELEREKIKDNFYKLTDYHHLNFLEYIPDHRDEQWKTYEDYVGIFYEDPNYVPDVPRSEIEQFFNWPNT